MSRKPKVPGHAEYEALAKDAQKRLRRLTARLASGKIDVDAWQDGFHAILFDGHSDAWAMGRQRSGVPGARDEDDERFGLDAADGQDEFLTPFAQALKDKDPRYFDEEGALRIDAVNDRNALYVARMRGTANEAFVESSEDDDLFDWVLGSGDSCEDCPELAGLSPYTKATMISHPGDGQTECLGNCTCTLKRRRGDLSGFDRPDIYRAGEKTPSDQETPEAPKPDDSPTEPVLLRKGERKPGIPLPPRS